MQMKIVRFLVKATLVVTLAGSFMLPAGCQKPMPNVKLKTDLDSVSYALGVSVGGGYAKDLTSFPKEINKEALIDGFIKGFYGDSTNFKINADEITPFLQNYFENLREEEKMKAELENTNILYKNRQREGVKVTESGLQYKIITEGKGAIPTEKDTVKVHYTGKFDDGRVFDSSVQRGEPVKFPVTGGVIPGWTEALKMMSVGSKWELAIPAKLAYGEMGFPRGGIPPNTVLFFDIELLDIVKAKK